MTSKKDSDVPGQMFEYERKYARAHYEDLKEHTGHDIRVDHGEESDHGDKWERMACGLWCEDCQEPVGKHAVRKRRVRL